MEIRDTPTRIHLQEDDMTSAMAARLRSSHEYGRTHMVSDYSVMLEAAGHIERIEEELEDLRRAARERAAEDAEMAAEAAEAAAKAARLERAMEGILLGRRRAGDALVHFTALGVRVFTIAEAAALEGVNPATLRQQVSRKKVRPAGRINPREAVYTAEQLVLDEARVPKVIGPADVQRLYCDLLEQDDSGAPWGDMMQTVEDFFVEHGMPTILYRTKL